MSTVNFSIPEDVKQEFNAAFEGQNKSAVLTQLMRDAVAKVAEQRRREAAGKRILARLGQAVKRSDKEIAEARRAMRP
jgi:metal-responsive CopG/Arc/MetJ family transcriptional regulator